MDALYTVTVAIPLENRFVDFQLFNQLKRLLRAFFSLGFLSVIR